MAETHTTPGRDPRPYQIAVLSTLLAYGLLWLDFEVALLQAAVSVASALVTQRFCSRLTGQRFDPRSALISGLSLALLLRTDQLVFAALGGAIAIASKFVLRREGRHVFNPSGLALVALMAAGAPVWISAGQWGSGALGALAVAGLGSLVLYRSARSDVTFAFLGLYAAGLLGRALWLGDPLAIPLHALQSGAFLVFAFFMISDPKTIPHARAGRVAHAGLVAAGALFVQYGLYEPNGFLWSLVALSPAVPLLDRLFPGERYAWTRVRLADSLPHPQHQETLMRRMRRRAALALGLALGLALPWDALAFCGFYVAKADTQLFNKASQVVLVRDGDRTVITMSNDFQGDPKEFAMVIPVPTFIEREQINVGDRKVIEHLDAYTSPRLVEYHDPDPCLRTGGRLFEGLMSRKSMPMAADAAAEQEAKAEGVTIEARYAVGEYEILILSAKESRGLAGWLKQNGYRLPAGAEPVLDSYLKQDMRFFVAKVNLEKHTKLGFSYLRPLQVAYESPKFMLPIRLGTLNADGTQELFVYTLTRKGRVETTNYRTVKLPTGMDIPTYVKGEFGDFYKAMFDTQVRGEGMRAVFTEYAWDMAWCDPCAADPLSVKELRDLGVFWAKQSGGPARNVFVTRLHVRYDGDHFPADLVFQETSDRSNFQGRYVMRHPFAGETSCSGAEGYWRQVRERQEREAQTLAKLTGWSLASIRDRMELDRPLAGGGEPAPWWKTIWE